MLEEEHIFTVVVVKNVIKQRWGYQSWLQQWGGWGGNGSFILSQGFALVKKYRHKYKYVVPR